MKAGRTRLIIGLTVVLLAIAVFFHLLAASYREQTKQLSVAGEKFDSLANRCKQNFVKLNQLQTDQDTTMAILTLESLASIPQLEKGDASPLDQLMKMTNELAETTRLIELATEQNSHALSAISLGLGEALQNYSLEKTRYDELAEQLLNSVDELITKAAASLKKVTENTKPKPPK